MVHLWNALHMTIKSHHTHFKGMNGALSADLARVLNIQGQPASPTHMQV